MTYLRNALVLVGAVLIVIVLLFKLNTADRCELCDDYIDDRASQPPQVLYRPPALYTELARKHRVQGIVQLRLSVDADGSVSRIEPVKTLPYGVTDEAIRAARQISFYPARSSRDFMVPGEIIVEYAFP